MKAIITGGGTGGHVFPALAIANKIVEMDPESEILYLGHEDSMESELAPKHGYHFKVVSSMWLEKNPIGFIKTSSSVLRGISESRKLIREFKPDCVIGTGGYVCFPVIIAAHREKIPCYIHEQNAFPGAANRTLERFVDNVFLAYPEATTYFKQPQKHIYTGNPVRKEFFSLNREEARYKLGISPDSFHILAMGGSWGARTINNIAVDILEWIQDRHEYSCTFISGHINYDDEKERILAKGIDTGGRGNLIGFVNDMPDQIAAADLIISRAGALTVTEINVAGKPSILIPFPKATDNHQYYNGKSIADRGGAILIEERDLKSEDLLAIIENYRHNPEGLAAMGEASLRCSPGDSTDRIWDQIEWRRNGGV